MLGAINRRWPEEAERRWTVIVEIDNENDDDDEDDWKIPPSEAFSLWLPVLPLTLTPTTGRQLTLATDTE